MNAKTPASLRAFICLLCSLGFCLQNASAQLSRPTEAKKDVDISVLDIPINDEPVNDLPSSDFPVKDVPVNIEPIRADVGLIEMVPDDPSMGSVDRMLIGPGMPGGPENLTPADIIASVYRSFPEINQARQQARLAQGEQIEAAGAYDVKFKAYTLSEPTGFYENYRNGLAFARQTWWGGQVAAGYRIGRGQFQPWYRERETEKGGEFKVGWIQPLLQGRAIDEQRVAVFRASLSRQMADPILQEAILNTSRDAMFAYWQWVAWGAVLEAQRELLEIAETRGSQFEVGVAAGKFAEIDLIVNQQVIAERRARSWKRNASTGKLPSNSPCTCATSWETQCCRRTNGFRRRFLRLKRCRQTDSTLRFHWQSNCDPSRDVCNLRSVKLTSIGDWQEIRFCLGWTSSWKDRRTSATLPQSPTTRGHSNW